jgi:hypothetical protein
MSAEREQITSTRMRRKVNQHGLQGLGHVALCVPLWIAAFHLGSGDIVVWAVAIVAAAFTVIGFLQLLLWGLHRAILSTYRSPWL